MDPPRGTFDTDVARVRLVLMRELETISVYEALAREAQGAEVKAFFEHLALEEKEHVAEATYLLRKLDPAQEARFQESYSESHFQGVISGATDPTPATPAKPFIPEEHRFPREPHDTMYALPAPPSAVAGALTVGSLKRRT